MADRQAQPHRSAQSPAGPSEVGEARLADAPGFPLLAAPGLVGELCAPRQTGSVVPAAPLLRRLQAAIGNQAIQRLLRQRAAPTARSVGAPGAPPRVQRQDAEPYPQESVPPTPATHHIYEPLDRRPSGRPPIVPGATLRQRSAAAEAAGYAVIRQRRQNPQTQVWETHVYAEVPRFEPVTRQQPVPVNGVDLIVRGATEAEIAAMQRVLAIVPAAHLRVLAQRRRSIVVVDWTGAPDPNQRRLSGGANISRARDATTRHHDRYPEDDIGEQVGQRIEVTHTSMAAGGEGTLLHETGHVIYEANLIPRQVHRNNYGSSVHAGASEQPAYAYMRFLQGRDLDPRDRTALTTAFRAQGIALPDGQPAATPTGGAAQRQPAGLVQRSPLSDEVLRRWQAAQRKGDVFDRLRAGPPAPADADLTAVLDRIFIVGSDDRWLAEQIQQHGPEPLWPAALLAERSRRAQTGRWAAEAGPIAAQLGTSAGGQPITAHLFPGRTDERALIISGVHGSELSGIEVVEHLLATLPTGPRPYYTVILVPRLFPDNATVAEGQPAEIGSAANVGRNTAGSTVDPNRQFPLPGQAFDPANPIDAGPLRRDGRRGSGRPIEPENIVLLELIDRFRPSRIASVHAVRDPDIAGIFADPRTDAAGRALGFADDKRLAVTMAQHARHGGANVPANLLGGTPNALYPRDPTAVAAGVTQPRDTRRGVSLGGWGASAVRDATRPERDRAAMTVITIEVQTAHRVADMATGAQAARSAEIEAHAAALREIFLGPPAAAAPAPAAPARAP
ncbi:MAG: hypothetical protein IT340_13290 [Chloroflexi bacterium]|nr:hypothetical protein [Chloroflexota bacterium]